MRADFQQEKRSNVAARPKGDELFSPGTGSWNNFRGAVAPAHSLPGASGQPQGAAGLNSTAAPGAGESGLHFYSSTPNDYRFPLYRFPLLPV
ncbi:MAG TPA: hypothetical protein VK641_06980 [Terriglobales bacterium]|nr:hypothetical protein [Terriglobales bacterium]